MGGLTWREDHVEVDGFRIRYVDAGDGPVLVHLHGGGGPALTPAHDLLASGRRVVAFEMPGFGDSPENGRHRTLLAAVAALGVDAFDLMGTSAGGMTALWAAATAPERVRALVLESPVAPHDAELERAMAALEVPVLVVLGTEDRLVPTEVGRAYKERLPNCYLLFVYDAGHPAADRPEAFAEAVSDFLERHGQYVVSDRSGVLFP